MIQVLVAIVLGYLLGAIPTGAVVARLYKQVDLTAVGSRRTGATNVLRTLGPGAAAIVFAGDFLKGTLAVLLAAVIAPGQPLGSALAGIAAVFGHAYSPFIGFKGGRGVTTGLGGLLAIAPAFAALGLLVGSVAIALTHYVSLGSILGTVAATMGLIVWTLASGQPTANLVFAVVVGGFIFLAHADNIKRLRQGTERRLGERLPAEIERRNEGDTEE